MYVSGTTHKGHFLAITTLPRTGGLALTCTSSASTTNKDIKIIRHVTLWQINIQRLVQTLNPLTIRTAKVYVAVIQRAMATTGGAASEILLAVIRHDPVR